MRLEYPLTAQRIRNQTGLFGPLQKLPRLGMIGARRQRQGRAGGVPGKLGDAGVSFQCSIDTGLELLPTEVSRTGYAAERQNEAIGNGGHEQGLG